MATVVLVVEVDMVEVAEVAAEVEEEMATSVGIMVDTATAMVVLVVVAATLEEATVEVAPEEMVADMVEAVPLAHLVISPAPPNPSFVDRSAMYLPLMI